MKCNFTYGEDWIAIDLKEKRGKSHIGGNITSSLFTAEIVIVVTESADDLYFNYACIAMAPMRNFVVMLMEVETYAKLKCQDPAAQFAVLHEVGHYVNGDLNKTLEERADLYERRRALLYEGIVYEKEIKADYVALCYMGQTVAATGLNRLKEMVMQLSIDAELAASEAARRIAILENA